MDERRAVLRHRTFLKGVLAFHNGNSSEDCLVRDITSRGAQIELPHPRAPENFDLIVPGRETRATGRVVWRHGVRFGLSLENTGPLTQKPAKRAALHDDGY